MYDDFEKWETEAEMFNAQDWEALIKYRKYRAEREPECIYYQWALGDAYMLNKEYEKAIDFFGALHKRCADNPNIQYSLLTALLALGKDETDFDWIVPPNVMKLDGKTLDFCFEYLRRKRKLRTVEDLYLQCCLAGYPMFRRGQLIQLLESDARFILTGDKRRSYDCYIAVSRKRKTRTGR